MFFPSVALFFVALLRAFSFYQYQALLTLSHFSRIGMSSPACDVLFDQLTMLYIFSFVCAVPLWRRASSTPIAGLGWQDFFAIRSYHNLTITACIRMTCRLGYISHLHFLEVLHSNGGSLRKVSFIVTQPSSLYIVRVGLSGVFRGHTHPEPIQGPASTETGSQLDPRVHYRTRRHERTHGLAHQSPIRARGVMATFAYSQTP